MVLGVFTKRYSESWSKVGAWSVEHLERSWDSPEDGRTDEEQTSVRRLYPASGWGTLWAFLLDWMPCQAERYGDQKLLF
jgi:hypothetical protein